LYQTKEKLNQE